MEFRTGHELNGRSLGVPNRMLLNDDQVVRHGADVGGSCQSRAAGDCKAARGGVGRCSHPESLGALQRHYRDSEPDESMAGRFYRGADGSIRSETKETCWTGRIHRDQELRGRDAVLVEAADGLDFSSARRAPARLAEATHDEWKALSAAEEERCAHRRIESLIRLGPDSTAPSAPQLERLGSHHAAKRVRAWMRDLLPPHQGR